MLGRALPTGSAVLCRAVLTPTYQSTSSPENRLFTFTCPVDFAPFN